MAGISREMLPLLSDTVFLRNIMLHCENASVLYEADLLRRTITHVLYKTRKGLDKNDSGTAKGAPSEYPTVIP